MNKEFFHSEELSATFGGKFFTVYKEDNKKIFVDIYNEKWWEFFKAFSYNFNKGRVEPIEEPSVDEKDCAFCFELCEDIRGFRKYETIIICHVTNKIPKDAEKVSEYVWWNEYDY